MLAPENAPGETRRTSRPQRSTAFVSFLLYTLYILVAMLPMARASAADRTLDLATTTSVRDSGLLEKLLPDFERETGIEVRVIAVGTGAALRMGREGDVDLLLTHAPAAEEVLLEEGIAIRRTPFMENFFVIAGPASDPANVADAPSPADAIRRIAASQSRWVSRDDDSGTHKREQSLFREAGLEADADWKGRERTGSGMGLSLQVAGEFRAYILSDIGTFLAFQERIDLVALSKPAESLRNIYSILQLDPKRFERPLASAAAEELERFLTRPSTQEEIGRFGRSRFGRPLFKPMLRPAIKPMRTPASAPPASGSAPVPRRDDR